MQNATCQGQNAKFAALLARRAAANIELERIKQSVDDFSSYDAYLDALLQASDSVAFLEWECRTLDKLSSAMQNATCQDPIAEALDLAGQLDAVPETGADPDMIVEAAVTIRLLCCLLSSLQSY